MTKFLLLMNYDGGTAETTMHDWDEADRQAHLDHLTASLDRMRERGELIDVQGLTWPKHAKVVRAASVSAPVITDGPYAEAKEILAGYTLIDVESEERALEIAAEQSSAPGPGGLPIEQPIEVRRLMGSDADFWDI